MSTRDDRRASRGTRAPLFCSMVAIASLLSGAQAAGAGSAEGEAVEESPAAAPVAAEATETETTPGNLRVRIGATGAIVNGDVAQFQQQHRIPEDISGGIEEFHYEKEVADDTELELDGRAIFDNRDYLLRLQLKNEDKGFLDFGYKQFRTWYDARGGYFPLANADFDDVIDPETGIDRGEGWAKGGLVLPKGFHLDLGYRYLSRSGSKNSITWGDSTALGLPSPNTRRDIVPAFWEIDEQRHQVDVALSRETEKSEVGAGIFYEHTDIDNKRNVTRNPEQAGLERRFTQTDDSASDTVVARAFGTRRLWEDKVVISGAYAYNDLDLDLGGSRIYGATFHPGFSLTSPNRQQRDEGFLDLGGSARMREHVGNFSMSARPWEGFQILSGLRARGESRHANSHFDETNVGGSPDFVTTIEELEAESDAEDVSFAQDIELRYTGIDHLVLYTSGAWEENNGDFGEAEIEPIGQVIDLERRTDVDRLNQKYAVGAKAYPLRWLHLSGEYAYRKSDYDYTHRIDSTPNDSASGDRYPAYLTDQTFATHDLGVRTTLRLPADVGVVLRYDWMQTTIDTEPDQLSEIESAQVRSHIIGGTVTWNPMAWWWTRAGANYVMNTTDTSANNYVSPVAGIYRSFDNDYLMTTVATGLALDAVTELEVGYNWISADNYRDISALGLSLGSRFDEHDVGFRVARRLNEHTKIAGGYSYANYDEAFAGGNYNYDAHLISTSVEFEY